METKNQEVKHIGILIHLMKFHNIKRVVTTYGSKNDLFIESLQKENFFEIDILLDEKVASFFACSVAEETGESVALICSSESEPFDWTQGIVDAAYMKLPVLIITASHCTVRSNDGFYREISSLQYFSNKIIENVTVDCVYTQEDEWACSLAINKAMIALQKKGGGPSHINLIVPYNSRVSVDELPEVKGINFFDRKDALPDLSEFSQIAILVGNHGKWTEELTDNVERFCELYNAVVLKYHASNYTGKYGVNHAVMLKMRGYSTELWKCGLVIYIGSIPRYHSGMDSRVCEMWRVNPDGIIRDPEEILTKVFAMREEEFFQYYVELKEKNDLPDKSKNNLYAKAWQAEYARVIAKTPDLPLSNVWIAKNTINRIPDGSVLHMAGSNTARAWNFFELPNSVECYSNDGAMGIDGQVSALIGESLADPKRLHFGVVGDLTFFYDMNSIGNRHVGANLRLLVVNNGLGAEFRIYSNPAYQFGEDGRSFMAAAGHFGNKSPNLLKHYAEDLGFEYLSAYSKEEFLNKIERFLTVEPVDKPMIFEVFTCEEDESKAIYEMNHMAQSTKVVAKEFLKGAIKSVAGEKGTAVLKKMLKR